MAGRAAEHEVAQAGMREAAHHQEVGAELASSFRYRLANGATAAVEMPEARRDAVPTEMRTEMWVSSMMRF
jgi:hypothetical protein